MEKLSFIFNILTVIFYSVCNALVKKIFTVTFISRLLFMKDKTKTQKCAEFFSHTKLCAGKKIYIYFFFQLIINYYI